MQNTVKRNCLEKCVKIKSIFIALITILLTTSFSSFASGEIVDPFAILAEYNKGYIDIGANESDEKGVVDLTLTFNGGSTKLISGATPPLITDFSGKMNIVGTNLEYTLSGLPVETVSENFSVLANLSGTDVENFELTSESKNIINFTVRSGNFTPINNGVTVSDKNLFANGNPITIIKGTTTDYSNIYYTNDIDKICINIDGVEATDAGYNLSGFRIYGGGEKVDLTSDTSIKIEGGKVLYVYGGGGGSNSNRSITTGNTTIKVSGGTVTEDIIGGGNFSAVNGSTKIEVSGGSVTAIYGGGNNADSTVFLNTEIVISGGEILGNIHGGGKTATVSGNSSIKISGGKISGKVCGGGVNSAATIANCEINISGGIILQDILSAGNVNGDSNILGGKVLKISGNPKIGSSAYGIKINGGATSFAYGFDSFDSFEIENNLTGNDKDIIVDLPTGFELGIIATSVNALTDTDLAKFDVENIEGKMLKLCDDGKGFELTLAIYQITFNANGGIGDNQTQDFTYNIAKNLSVNTFTRDGSTFLGWAESENGDVVYSDGASYSATSDKILYAKWRTLTGIVISAPPTKTKYFKGAIFNPAGMEVKANYSDNTSKVVTNYTFTESFLTLQDTNVTISYTEKNSIKSNTQAITVTEYKIILDENGGRLGSFEIYRPVNSNLMPVIDVNNNKLSKPERPGFIFIGYFSEKEEGGYEYYNEEMKPANWTSDTNLEIIYARWKAEEIFVYQDSLTWALGTLKIKPTTMKESVKIGSSLQFDIANKFCDANQRSVKAPTVYTILSAKLADEFSDVGTIEVIGGKKIKFTPKLFYYTAGFGGIDYHKEAVKFSYEISAEVSGKMIQSEFTGFIAVEPVNQAPNIWVEEKVIDGKINKYLVKVITEKNYLGHPLPQLIDADEDDIKIVSRPASILTVIKNQNGDVKWTKGNDNVYTAEINVVENVTGEATITINVEDENELQKEYVGKGKDLSARLVYKINLGVENKEPSFSFNIANQDGENGFCTVDENIKPAVMTVSKVLGNISAGTDETTQKVKFNLLIDSEYKVKFKKLPTLKINSDKTADISFTLAPNVCEDIKFTILAMDSGVPVKEFSREFSIRVKPLLPTVKSFMIYARDSDYNFVQASMIDRIKYFSADFIFSDRVNVAKTKYLWTVNDVSYYNKEIEVSNLKIGDIITLKIEMEDDFSPAQKNTWEKSFFVGNPEWYPALNLKNFLPEYCEENGTYQVTMTQGKITNKVTCNLRDSIGYIFVSDYIAAKAKGFLPNQEVKITAIAKAINGKLEKAQLVSNKSFVISDYGMPDQTVDFEESANLQGGIFSINMKLLDAAGFDYEVWGGDVVDKLKKIVNGKIVFTDKDYYNRENDFAAQEYLFEHSVSFAKITNSNVYYQLKIRPFNPLYTPKSFIVTNTVMEHYETPTTATDIEMIDVKSFYNSVYDFKNTKTMVKLSWIAIKDADFYTVTYKQTHKADGTNIVNPKNIKKKIGKILYFDVALGKGKYTWSLQATTNIKSTVNQKDKITATPGNIPDCGEFIIK